MSAVIVLATPTPSAPTYPMVLISATASQATPETVRPAQTLTSVLPTLVTQLWLCVRIPQGVIPVLVNKVILEMALLA